jgi:hypothetical protein
MPFDLGLGGAVWMALAITLAAFIRGYSGFGYSAIVIAAAGLVMNPLDFVAVVVILEFSMSLQAWRGAGPSVDWKRIRCLMIGAAVGLPLGLWALSAIEESAARAVISGYILLMCGLLLAGLRLGSEVRATPVNIGAGLISGLANAPGMGGLPVAAFYAAQPMPAAVFRATPIFRYSISIPRRSTGGTALSHGTRSGRRSVRCP